MSAEDEKWIKKYRMKNDIWNIFFLERNNGCRKKEIDIKAAKMMSRDILDAKKNRITESPFSKNPHLAQLSLMIGLKITGLKMNESEIKDLILDAVKTKNA
jgi:hypothetical protein